MAYILFFVCWLSNFFNSFSKKSIRIFVYLSGIFLWILFWSNTNNPDYNNYYYLYQNVDSMLSVDQLIFYQEIGFIFLMKIGNIINMSYSVFLATITLISYILIYSTLKKFSPNKSYVLFLYLIFPFFIDVVQIKNFLVMSILIYAINYLITNEKIKFFICILIASTIHVMAFLYLPFVLIKTNKNYLARLIIVVSIIGSVFVVVKGRQIPFLEFLIFDERTEMWFNSRTNYGFLLFWSLHIISFILLFISKKMMQNYKNDRLLMENSYSNRDIIHLHLKFVDLIFWINAISFMYFPLYVFASTFTRLMRNLMILNYVVFSIVNQYSRGYSRLFYNIIVYIYIIIYFLFQLYPDLDLIINPILSNNIFS